MAGQPSPAAAEAAEAAAAQPAPQPKAGMSKALARKLLLGVPGLFAGAGVLGLLSVPMALASAAVWTVGPGCLAVRSQQ